MRVSGRNRLEQGPTAAVRADLEAHIAHLSDQGEAMGRSIGESIPKSRGAPVEASRLNPARPGRYDGRDPAAAPEAR